MGERTIKDLQMMQAAPLSVKVRMTQRRIREWVDEFGTDGVYVSFSGGKDSTVLLHIVREMYPNVPAVFVDTGLEYPEIREFVKTFDKVEWLKPKLTFRQVLEKFGYPFISKEVSEKAYYAQRYVRWYLSEDAGGPIPTAYAIAELLGIKRQTEEYKEIIRTGNVPKEVMDVIFRGDGPAPVNAKKAYGTFKYAPAKARAIYGTYMHKENGKETDEVSSIYNFSRHRYLITAPFKISSHCCNVMKKGPVKAYAKKTGRKPMTGQQASESRLRQTQWMKNGCNGFEMKSPISNPMSFWTEQDVLLYIYRNRIPIASVYGDIVKDNGIDGQMDIEDIGIAELEQPKLKTTGCNRTGCIFCGYGCHLEQPGEGRFERLKETHPKQYDYLMRPESGGGLGYREKIDWLNEHGNLNIRY